MRSIFKSILIAWVSIAATHGLHSIAMAQTLTQTAEVDIFSDPSVENGLLPAMGANSLHSFLPSQEPEEGRGFKAQSENFKGYQHSYASLVADCFWQRGLDACKSVTASSEGFVFAIISTRNPALVTHAERRLDFACQNNVTDSCEARAAIARYKQQNPRNE